jgi:hypothetical protein
LLATLEVYQVKPAKKSVDLVISASARRWTWWNLQFPHRDLSDAVGNGRIHLLEDDGAHRPNGRILVR